MGNGQALGQRDGENQGVPDVGLQPGKPAPNDTGAAGAQQVHAAVARGSFTPEVAAAILRSNPADVAKIVDMLQQNFGNGFVQQAMAHAGAESHGEDHAPSSTHGPDKAAPTGGKTTNPALPTWDDKLAGTLWAKDSEGHDRPPTLADISQGGVKDCFLFAAMAAIVHTHPDQIQHMIKDHRNGTYTVAFKGTGTIFSDKQDVNLEFDAKKHGTVTGTKALWPLIIEKAYGQESGGLDKIDNGGNSGEAVETLTNKEANRFDPRTKTMPWLLARFAKAEKEKCPTTILSPAPGAASAEAVAIQQKMPSLKFWHCYTLVDVDTKSERIKLFNPWGVQHPNGDGWVNMIVVMNFFSDVEIND